MAAAGFSVLFHLGWTPDETRRVGMCGQSGEEGMPVGGTGYSIFFSIFSLGEFDTSADRWRFADSRQRPVSACYEVGPAGVVMSCIGW